MSEKTVAKKSKKKSISKKSVALCVCSGILLIAFIFLWYFLPFQKAAARLEDIKEILKSGEYERIIVGQPNAYPSGSAAQIGKDFEKSLTKDEESILISALLSSSKATLPKGSNVQSKGFWDIKVTVITNQERLILYVDKEYVYLTDKSTRFNFVCESSALYDLITEWKK